MTNTLPKLSLPACLVLVSQISHTKHVFFYKCTLSTIVNALGFSKLFYCSNLGANTSKLKMSKLQSIQNIAAQIVTRAHKYHHITPIPKELKWLPVATQLYFGNAVVAFKCLTSHVPEYHSSQFTKQGERIRCTTRSSQMLNMPLFKSASGLRTFNYRTVNIWNS